LLALISFSRDAGDIPTALEYAERLAGMTPGDRDVTALIETFGFSPALAEVPENGARDQFDKLTHQ